MKILDIIETKEYDNEEEYRKAYAAWKKRNPSDNSAYGGEAPPVLKSKSTPEQPKKKSDSDDGTLASTIAALF